MNFQNIPRSDKVIKQAIVPRLGALSFFDYSAIEPRLFAYYADRMGHPSMAEQVRAGVDPYTAVAALIEQKEDITPEERQHWKVFFLSLMYGGGVRTIQAQFDCTQTEARRMVNQFHRNFPAVRALQDSVARVSKRRGYVVGIDGRHLHPEPFGEHKMLNKLIQGGAAGIMKAAIIRVHRELSSESMHVGTGTRPYDPDSAFPQHVNLMQRPQSRIVSVVHDELQIDGPVNELLFLNNRVPALMRDPTVDAVVPIEVEHEYTTTNWAEKEVYEVG
jgi:DNA polymerase I-like protein with 3'-5' exonuclease and polymerase domains